jgi:amino acid permease
VQKEIDNDEEKLRYFKKQVSSYRSTLFLIFICMVCCCITAWLQFALYNGYYEILAGCAVVFVICFIAFMVYSRYLRINRKRAKLLRGKIKERKRQLEQNQAAKNDSQLDEEWNSLEEPKQKKKAKKMKKAKK